MTDLAMRRGDTFRRQISFTLASGSIAGSKIWFTIKRRAMDADAVALLQVTTDDAIEIDGPLSATINVPASATLNLPAGTWVYDIQIKLTNGEVYTTQSGAVRIADHVTHAIE